MRIARKNYITFIKYGVVGVAGTFIDLASLFVFVEYFSIPAIPGSILSFLLAVTNNFILNKIWTFENRSKNYRKLFLKFLIVSVIGLGLTIASMYVMTLLIGLWYMLAKALTSIIVLTWNFLANKLWTFRHFEKNIKLQNIFTYDLTIIIPAYNEENRIKNTLIIINDYVQEKNINAEIIVVDDGSTDLTTNIVEKLKAKIPHLKLINLEHNQGKGFSVRKGVESSQGKFILFTDADNSTPIEEYEKLMDRMKNAQAQIAIGSRFLHDSKVHIAQPAYRIFLGRAANLLIRIFLIDGLRDTQCGFKLFEHNAAKEIFSFQKIKRFAFDMEALLVGVNLGYKIIEVPISWYNSSESRVRPIRDALTTLKDLFLIKLNLWSGRYSRDDS